MAEEADRSMKPSSIRDMISVLARILRTNLSGFGKPFLRALPWIVVIMVAVMLLENAGAFTGFEAIALDTFVRLKSSTPSGDVVIVEIDDDDYRQYFSSKSPLKPSQLVSLISTVAQGKPRVIGVDIDTSSDAWCDENVLFPTDSQNIPVVWAGIPDRRLNVDGASQGSGVLRRLTSRLWSIVTEEEEAPRFAAAPVLGGRMTDARCVGIPLFPLDRDGVVRRERTDFEVGPLPESCARAAVKCMARTSLESGDEVFSLAHVIAAQVHPAHREPPSQQILNFARDQYTFRTIHAREILTYSQRADGSWPTYEPAWLQQDLLKDSVVLIGGTYSAARDKYNTPVGPKPGVLLVAQTIEAHLHPGGVQEARWFWKKLVDFFSAIVIVWLYYRFRTKPRRAFRMSVLGTIGIAIVGSFLLFDTMAYWFDFIPVVIGMLIHQMYEQSKMVDELEQSQVGVFHASRPK